MTAFFITGATGNVGAEVIRALAHPDKGDRIVAGVRDPHRAGAALQAYPIVETGAFDFGDPAGFDHAFQGIEYVFLLRPPRITAVETVFPPLIAAIRRCGIKGVLFLSVQGVGKSAFIPHHKIEALLTASGIPFIFVRPGYFMQNLTTTLLDDIRKRLQVILPAGAAKFNWIDVADIGEACTALLRRFAERERAVLDTSA